MSDGGKEGDKDNYVEKQERKRMEKQWGVLEWILQGVSRPKSQPWPEINMLYDIVQTI